MLPNHVGYRDEPGAATPALAGDFQARRSEAQKLIRSRIRACAAVARLSASWGAACSPQATETYKKLGNDGRARRVVGRVGLGDLAIYEGRFSDAVRDSRARRDRGSGGEESRPRGDQVDVDRLRAAAAGRNGPAIAAAEKALRDSKAMPCDSWRRASSSRPAQSTRRGRWPTPRRRSCRPSRRPTARSSKGRSR